MSHRAACHRRAFNSSTHRFARARTTHSTSYQPKLTILFRLAWGNAIDTTFDLMDFVQRDGTSFIVRTNVFPPRSSIKHKTATSTKKKKEILLSYLLLPTPPPPLPLHHAPSFPPPLICPFFHFDNSISTISHVYFQISSLFPPIFIHISSWFRLSVVLLHPNGMPMTK